MKVVYKAVRMFVQRDKHMPYEEVFSVEIPLAAGLGPEIKWFSELFANVYHVEGLCIYASSQAELLPLPQQAAE